MSIYLYSVSSMGEARDLCSMVCPSSFWTIGNVFIPELKSSAYTQSEQLIFFTRDDKIEDGAAFIYPEIGPTRFFLEEYIENIFNLDEVNKDSSYYFFSSNFILYKIFLKTIAQKPSRKNSFFVLFAGNIWKLDGDNYLTSELNRIEKLPRGFFNFEESEIISSPYRF